MKYRILSNGHRYRVQVQASVPIDNIHEWKYIKCNEYDGLSGKLPIQFYTEEAAEKWSKKKFKLKDEDREEAKWIVI